MTITAEPQLNDRIKSTIDHFIDDLEIFFNYPNKRKDVQIDQDIETIRSLCTTHKIPYDLHVSYYRSQIVERYG